MELVLQMKGQILGGSDLPKATQQVNNEARPEPKFGHQNFWSTGLPLKPAIALLGCGLPEDRTRVWLGTCISQANPREAKRKSPEAG